MTIFMKAATKESWQSYEAMIKELYYYIDLDAHYMPLSYAYEESTGELTIYISDKFMNYIFTFLYELFKINQMKSKTSKAKLDSIVRKFRQGAEEYLMSDILLY